MYYTDSFVNSFVTSVFILTTVHLLGVCSDPSVNKVITFIRFWDTYSMAQDIDPRLLKVHINVMLPPTPRSSKWSLPLGPPNQNPVNTPPLPHACHMFRPPHPPWFNLPNNIRWRIQAVKLLLLLLLLLLLHTFLSLIFSSSFHDNTTTQFMFVLCKQQPSWLYKLIRSKCMKNEYIKREQINKMLTCPLMSQDAERYASYFRFIKGLCFL